jgi:predicted RNA-binding Zn-ribbon protein involved in translation (DUF1610 family)
MFEDVCVWIVLSEDDELVTECGQQLWLDPDADIRYCPYCGKRRMLMTVPDQTH